MPWKTIKRHSSNVKWQFVGRCDDRCAMCAYLRKGVFASDNSVAILEADHCHVYGGTMRWLHGRRHGWEPVIRVAVPNFHEDGFRVVEVPIPMSPELCAIEV